MSMLEDDHMLCETVRCSHDDEMTLAIRHREMDYGTGKEFHAATAKLQGS